MLTEISSLPLIMIITHNINIKPIISKKRKVELNLPLRLLTNSTFITTLALYQTLS